MAKYNEGDCFNTLSRLFAYARDYNETGVLLAGASGAGARDFLQSKKDGHYDIFRREVAHLVKNCGLPENPCGRKCKNVAVKERT